MFLVFGFVIFLPISNLFANSGWHEVVFPTTISYASMMESERAEAGFVAAVDSGKVFGEKSWSYELTQGGGYKHQTHTVLEEPTPLCNLYLELIHQHNIDLGSFGTSQADMGLLKV
jgi:hypothetical protein